MSDLTNIEINKLIEQKEQQKKRIELLVNLVTTLNKEVLRLRKFASKNITKKY